ncbi:helix-turn-helix transcriptional regulator [Streptomyces sp. MBT53]|uniref:helix-turn-helix domain-containing protein n=1 Tax=Streptomyces sp. MBT53 TaxID=1488384 RepID=UPI0019125FA4|nr:helix-turn-helix transcriptional regulator [Streptomyces sp. MBT53]MBK6018371.1 helix-turn-helix domain-containing protein [Streptomyces sp. MBT53]
MAPRNQPTARQVRLGVELRKLRDLAGMSAREAAGLLTSTSAQMSQIEAGLSGVSEERVRRLGALYACADEELIDALVAMATDRTRGWWEEYRGVLPPGFLDLSELEHHARYLRVVSTAHVPGLLQTEEYARALLGAGNPHAPTEATERRVALRMRRQELLTREAPPRVWVVMDETVLRWPVGGAAVMRAQIDHLIEVNRLPHVTLQIMPFANGPHPAMRAGAFHLFRFRAPELPDVVYLNGLVGAVYLDKSDDVVVYREALDRLGAQAAPARKTEALLGAIRKEL